jgi:hypothetical protein
LKSSTGEAGDDGGMIQEKGNLGQSVCVLMKN